MSLVPPQDQRSLAELRETCGNRLDKQKIAVLVLDEHDDPVPARVIADQVHRYGGISSCEAATALRTHPSVEHETCPDRGVHVYWTTEGET
ncbi:hypothetical protein BRD56_05325 [Thermoplasmatales archaeon SW_10_69_26]|nr:MAG: hypothetical protein BRD56_05325 [Thermoplasmatales archaeon SW_10_69_26]